jgi:hypothetical protein
MRGEPRRPERELVTAASRYLEARGFRTWSDLDGRDYFDLVARRGEEVGLVEAKVRGAREVLAQALRRRAWGDWTAVVLGSERAARALADRTAAARAGTVGVWFVRAGEVHEVRAARRRTATDGSDPYADLRARFAKLLDALESGALPAGVRWDGLLREIRRASGGRGFREWRLDEPPP